MAVEPNHLGISSSEINHTYIVSKQQKCVNEKVFVLQVVPVGIDRKKENNWRRIDESDRHLR